ncbi:MAG: carbohydrate-binding domain-containing protein [Velocimicrobium sp.]
MKKRTKLLGIVLCIVLVFAGCQASTSVSTNETTNEDTSNTETKELNIAVEVTQITGDYSDQAIQAEWSLEESTQITFDGSSIAIDGEGVSEENGIVTILKGGTYVISGILSDGQILVSASENETVQLVLNGVHITCSNQAAIVIESAKITSLTLADGTENSVTDGSEYVFENEEEHEPDAAIFSKDDLIINGSGSLTVTANYNDGIKGKDDLQIIGGSIEINAVGDGIVGKDSVSIRTGNITINAQKDGIKSSNDSDAEKGYIIIDGGVIDITAGNDGIQASTVVCVNDGTFNIITNAGSENASATSNSLNEKPGGGNPGGGNGEMQPPSGDMQSPDGEAQREDNQDRGERLERPDKTMDTTTDTTTDVIDTETETNSAKALKSDYNIGIYGGTFTIDSADDGIHANQSVTIVDGMFCISSGNDGVHADINLEISGGTISILTSYEGLEADDITILEGTIDLVATDDGVNASDGTLTINGGTLTVDASGDGLDANGSIQMTGGYVTISGPTNDGNGTLDYDETFDISGGVLLGAGSLGMAQTPSSDSKQASIAIAFDNTVAAGTQVEIQDESGDVIYTFTPVKEFVLVEVSAPEIISGKSYTIIAGDQNVGVNGGETSNLTTMGVGMRVEK